MSPETVSFVVGILKLIGFGLVIAIIGTLIFEAVSSELELEEKEKNQLDDKEDK